MTSPGGPNPQRLGACPGCGAYRADGRWPYLHRPGCEHTGDLQFGRWLEEQRTRDHAGPLQPRTVPAHLSGEDSGPLLWRPAEVSCDEHGPMVRDDLRCAWLCPQRCGRWLPDEEAVHLIEACPDGWAGGDPLQIRVT